MAAINSGQVDPIFYVDAKGDNKKEVKGHKANAERPDEMENITGSGYSMAIIDTGLNYTDGNFSNYLAGYDYCSQPGNPCSGVDEEPMDYNSHGSHVAAIAAANDPANIWSISL